MSLVQHVSALDGADRDPDVFDDIASLQLSRVGSRQRRTSISYDPVNYALDQEVNKLEPVGAYDVSVQKRVGMYRSVLLHAEFDVFVAQVIIGVVSCALASGIVFGFAALKPILVDRDAYRELCTEEELREEVVVCYKQDLK